MEWCIGLSWMVVGVYVRWSVYGLELFHLPVGGLLRRVWRKIGAFVRSK